MADKITATPSDNGVTVTRLVAGVELKLRTSGKHWILTAKPSKE